MSFGIAHLNPTDLLGAIRKCWEDPSDRQFEAFFSAWCDFMKADLAQFIDNATPVEQVCQACREEYRHQFSAPHNAQIDYALFFRAIAYSHLSHLLLKDRGLRTLFRAAGPSTSFVPGPHNMSHETCVVVFAAMLSMDNGCAGYLLDVCFELALGGDPRGCLGTLRRLLAAVC